jgi:hypothetical protein
VNLPEDQRAALIDLLERCGQRHSGGTITITLTASRRSCTTRHGLSTRGQLREAFVTAIEPAAGKPLGQRAETQRPGLARAG